jgi:hypothetical protein
MFLDTTPDTSGYMIAGFAVSFLVMGIYVASLYIRNRNFKQDIETLESVQTEKPKSQK